MMNRTMATSAAAALALLLLSGCGAGSEQPKERDSTSSDSPVVEPEPVTDPVPEPEPEPEGPEDAESAQDDSNETDDQDFAAALAEREQFIQDQQLPLDGSLLVATTDAQKEFISAQREHVESQGGTWNAETESVTLALAADACESAILNYHDSDTFTVQVHIMTSPLFEALIPADLPDDQRVSAEANMASIAVYGMRFMCPDDHPQWKAAFDELYPGHGGG